MMFAEAAGLCNHCEALCHLFKIPTMDNYSRRLSTLCKISHCGGDKNICRTTFCWIRYQHLLVKSPCLSVTAAFLFIYFSIRLVKISKWEKMLLLSTATRW